MHYDPLRLGPCPKDLSEWTSLPPPNNTPPTYNNTHKHNNSCHTRIRVPISTARAVHPACQAAAHAAPDHPVITATHTALLSALTTLLTGQVIDTLRRLVTAAARTCQLQPPQPYSLYICSQVTVHTSHSLHIYFSGHHYYSLYICSQVIIHTSHSLHIYSQVIIIRTTSSHIPLPAWACQISSCSLKPLPCSANQNPLRRLRLLHARCRHLTAPETFCIPPATSGLALHHARPIRFTEPADSGCTVVSCAREERRASELDTRRPCVQVED